MLASNGHRAITPSKPQRSSPAPYRWVRKNLRIVPSLHTCPRFGPGDFRMTSSPGFRPVAVATTLDSAGKDRCIRANAQREGKNGNARKPGILRQHPQAVRTSCKSVCILTILRERPLRLLTGRRNREPSIPKRPRRHQIFISSAPGRSCPRGHIRQDHFVSDLQSLHDLDRVHRTPPNFTLTRTASDPSSMILKIPIVLSAAHAPAAPQKARLSNSPAPRFHPHSSPASPHSAADP